MSCRYLLRALVTVPVDHLPSHVWDAFISIPIDDGCVGDRGASKLSPNTQVWFFCLKRNK